jgi:hypothetical protein
MKLKNHHSLGDKRMQVDKLLIPWKCESSHLVSLLDMINLCAKEFCDFMRELDELFKNGLFDSSRGGYSNDELKRIQEVIDKTTKWCKLMELDAAPRLIKPIDFAIKYSYSWDINQPREDLGNDILRLWRVIEDELEERFFKYIPQEDTKWYEKEDSFGIKVSTAFPSAKDDIKEAGTCFATERYTACVFHLMRVLEHGLRALAKDVKLSFGKKTWGKIIGIIEDNIKDLEKANFQTEEEIERLQFLSQAATDFRYFKNSWRNHVSHLRYTCKDRLEALLILNHVNSFMNHLSKKLSE